MDTASRQAAEAYCQALTAQGADTVELVPGEMPPDGGAGRAVARGGVDVVQTTTAKQDTRGWAGWTRCATPWSFRLPARQPHRAARPGHLPWRTGDRGCVWREAAPDLPSDLGRRRTLSRGRLGRATSARGGRQPTGRDPGSGRAGGEQLPPPGDLGGRPGLQAVAWSEDDVVEAVESESAVFLIGVQWHPERMLESESARRLFAVFVEAARDYAKGKGTRG